MLKPGQTKNGHPRVWVIRRNDGPGAASPAVAVLAFLRGATLEERVSTRNTVIAIRNSLTTGGRWGIKKAAGDEAEDRVADAVRSLGVSPTSLLCCHIEQDRRVVGGLWMVLNADTGPITDRIRETVVEPALTVSPWSGGLLRIGAYVTPAKPQPPRVEPVKITSREIAVKIAHLSHLQARLRERDVCLKACELASKTTEGAVNVTFNGLAAFTTSRETAARFASEHLSMIEAELDAAGVAFNGIDDGDPL